MVSLRTNRNSHHEEVVGSMVVLRSLVLILSFNDAQWLSYVHIHKLTAICIFFKNILWLWKTPVVIQKEGDCAVLKQSAVLIWLTSCSITLKT